MSARLDPAYPAPPSIPGQLYVPDRLTPMNLLEAACAYNAAILHVFRMAPTRAALCTIVAQAAFETGWWKFCHLDNFTNMKTGPTYRGAFTAFRCNEIIKGKIEWFDPYNPQTWFRAFVSTDSDPLVAAQKSHAMGAEAAVRFIGTGTRGPGKPNRYALAWEAGLDGDPDAYALELGRAGFYTANKDAYRRGVVGVYQRCERELPLVLPAVPHIHDPIVLQPTEGHNRFSDEDLRERIAHLQIPLVIDWDELRRERDAAQPKDE